MATWECINVECGHRDKECGQPATKDGYCDVCYETGLANQWRAIYVRPHPQSDLGSVPHAGNSNRHQYRTR